MPRPTKIKTPKRFSLRMPEDVLRAAQHNAIDAGLTTNDWIRERIKRKRRVQRRWITESEPPIAEHNHRYPLRLTPPECLALSALATASRCSRNTWIVAAIQQDAWGKL